MGKRKRPMPSFYGKNIAQHAQHRAIHARVALNLHALPA